MTLVCLGVETGINLINVKQIFPAVTTRFRAGHSEGHLSVFQRGEWEKLKDWFEMGGKA